MSADYSAKSWSNEELDDALSQDHADAQSPAYDADIGPIDFVHADLEDDVVQDDVAPVIAAAPIMARATFNDVGHHDQPVPRIAIHASCDRSDVARAVAAAGRDRRLSKASVTVELGGIEAAIARLSSARSPDLLILDSVAQPAALLRQLDGLAEHVDEGSKVIVIGAANDIALYRELMARGVSDYLVGPIDPIDLARAISKLYVDPSKPFAGRIVSVIGAKGGVGASTVAHNIAWNIAERCGANATLVDLDLPFGTAALDFNQEPTTTVAEALIAPDRIDPVFLDRLVTRQTERLLLFSSPGAVDRDYEFDEAAYDVLIDTVRRTAPYIVLDLPHAWTPWLRDTLVGSDSIAIVATPELASLRNAKNMIDRLTRARANDAPPQVILNMAGVAKRPEIPAKDFAEALGCPLACVIPFEPAVFGMAANNGQMLGELETVSKSAAALEEFAANLCGRTAAPRKKASILDQLPFLKR